MTTLFRRTANVFCALLIAVASVNLIGVSQVYASHGGGHGGPNPGGNNGTLKVHEKGTPSGAEDNDPKVCKFNFEGFGFNPGQSGLIIVTPKKQDSTLTIPFGPVDDTGYAQTRYINDGQGSEQLRDGHYTAVLYGKDGDDSEKAKSKVFKVVCDTDVSVSVGDCVPGMVTPSVTVMVNRKSNKGGNNAAFTLSTSPVLPGTPVRINDVRKNTPRSVELSGLEAGKTYVITVAGPNGAEYEESVTVASCIKEVTVVKPDETHMTCDDKSSRNTYTIPSVTGVDYYVNDVKVDPREEPHEGHGTVIISAREQAGYQLSGYDGPWKLEFVDVSCNIIINELPVITIENKCGKKNDAVIIPKIDGVEYYVNGQVVTYIEGASQAKVEVSGHVLVEARAAGGYEFSGSLSTDLITQTLDISTTPCTVTICHATRDYDSPYKSKTITRKAAKKHAVNHTGDLYSPELEAWGDIIPHKLNWTEAGQSIARNDCNVAPTVVETEAPTLVEACTVGGVIVNMPDTNGIEYSKSTSWSEDDKKMIITVTATAKPGYKLAEGAQTEWVLINDFTDCPNGRGGAGGEESTVPVTPTTPAVPALPVVTPVVARGQMPAEMPQTGASSQLAQFIATLALAAATYVATYYLQGRRKLDANE